MSFLSKSNRKKLYVPEDDYARGEFAAHTSILMREIEQAMDRLAEMTSEAYAASALLDVADDWAGAVIEERAETRLELVA